MNKNDMMYLTFKIKTIEELLKKIIIKVDNIEQNFNIFKSDFDCAYINHISEEIQNELNIELHDVNEPQ